MPQKAHLLGRSDVFVLAAVIFCPLAVVADAIFPSLVLVWPITILLFIPVVLIEAAYARWQMPVGFWKLVRVTAISNLVSAVAGLPVAQLLSTMLQYALEAIRFRDVAALRAQAPNLVSAKPLSPHATGTLILLGLYPRWIMLLSAVVMVGVCYVVSWWIEGAWLRRPHQTHHARTGGQMHECCAKCQCFVLCILACSRNLGAHFPLARRFSRIEMMPQKIRPLSLRPDRISPQASTPICLF